ncbi:DNA adenine methylase [Kaistia dalseonensis]|uniref:site-specific DNA-methyltransferase (adenine-specific) n=1 Tax=Kaistia dalseonensis TaxID=410840 RepID=A0ABU0H7W3_9HYPH|nr:DNA adenine methylase [Kaistia dalseonensis]MCX5495794.1 DNA adenine methylase [Kaistia dalseonensis]MDQ0438395.1 DNA adenine methylase [Kaistia dalseonensis]
MSEHEFRAVPPARPVAGYVGGKKILARRLAERIEATPHDLYGEVFAGMAGVFFKRRTAPKIEVLNDISRDVITFFRVLQNHHQALMDMLKWQLTSRDEFERLNGQDPERLTDLQRAARFLYLQRATFGGKVAGRTFGIDRSHGGRFNIATLADPLAAAHERLAGVWLECLPWQDFLDRWDRPGALFYLDPPYAGTEHYYGRGLFERSDYLRMAERLADLKGRFILSVNDHPDTRAAFADFAIETVDVTYSVSGYAGQKKGQGELIISGP